MATFKEADDKITAALILLYDAANLLYGEFDYNQDDDEDAYETVYAERLFQIHSAIDLLSKSEDFREAPFPDAKTVKFYPEPGSPNVTE